MYLVPLLIPLAWLAAETNPYAAKPGDTRLTRSSAIVEEAAIERVQGVPTLTLKGTLPTGCHLLRLSVPEQADSKNRIVVQAWSVVDPGMMCAQMLQPFTAALPMKKLKKGQYAVIVYDRELTKVELK
jgi:hypothetical protein